ncbi:hypothetical protein IQ07DRAFT_132819 [Pyrenochaeta sp. DS3sAY3a]|nr:hypothetical protein IQ07DRAFT_132819 [Pyrenochaeta sp. DS3sAY3a]
MPSIAVAEPEPAGACGADRRLPLVSALAPNCQAPASSGHVGKQRAARRGSNMLCTSNRPSSILSGRAALGCLQLQWHLVSLQVQSPRPAAPGTVHDCMCPASALEPYQPRYHLLQSQMRLGQLMFPPVPARYTQPTQVPIKSETALFTTQYHRELWHDMPNETAIRKTTGSTVALAPRFFSSRPTPNQPTFALA